MSSMQPLMTLLGKCERERDELAVTSQRAAMAHRSAVEQAQQLVVYRSEYEKRWAEQFRTDGRMELVYWNDLDIDPAIGAEPEVDSAIPHAPPIEHREPAGALPA